MKLANYTKFRVEKFGAVLFETRSEKVYTLNPTAAAVVGEIDAGTGCTADSIIERLHKRFRSGNGALAAEVTAFIADLRLRGLLED